MSVFSINTNLIKVDLNWVNVNEKNEIHSILLFTNIEPKYKAFKRQIKDMSLLA
jgi:hypothetical protein